MSSYSISSGRWLLVLVNYTYNAWTDITTTISGNNISVTTFMLQTGKTETASSSSSGVYTSSYLIKATANTSISIYQVEGQSHSAYMSGYAYYYYYLK